LNESDSTLTHDPRPGEPSIEAGAWRGVFIGLSLARVGSIAMALGSFGLTFFPYALAFLARASSFAAQCALAVLGIYYLLAGVAFLAGVGLCCLVPAETGAKHQAQSAFILSLVSVPIVGGLMALAAYRSFRTPRPLVEMALPDNLMAVILTFMISLNILFTVLCWHSFLRRLGTYFGAPGLVLDATRFQRAFVVWFGVLMVVPITGVISVSLFLALSLASLLWSTLGFLVLSVLEVSMVAQARRLVGQAYRGVC
jgi:hypothetical protein